MPKTAAEPNAEYLSKLKDLILSKTKDGDLSDADIRAIMKAAAGYSGGKQKGRNRADAQTTVEMTEEDGSLWVGYWLPPEMAAQLAIPGGEAPEELHLTLVYLGDISVLPSDAVERLTSAIETFSYSRRPVSFCVNGVSRFEAETGGQGKDVIYAVVDSQDVESIRMDLCFALANVGFPYPWGDREYVPHITLAYVDADSEVDGITLPNVDGMLDSLTVSTNRDAASRETFMLRGPSIDPYGYPLMMSEFIEPPAQIPVLPSPGTYTHPRWGEIAMSAERIAEFVSNFNDGVYQEKVPIDLEHETKLSGAAGYITRLVMNSDGSVDGVVEWTDRGSDALKLDRFSHVSPEWYEEWQDPITADVHENILIGAALTTRPFFKYKALRPLAASEGAQSEERGQRMPNDAKGAQTPPEAKVTPPDGSAAMSEEQSRRMGEMEREIAELKASKAAAETATTAATEAVKKAGEQIEAMHKDARTRRFTDEVTGRSADNHIRWTGEPAKHVAILEHLATTAGEDSEIFKDHVAQMRAAGEIMSKSAAFREVGSSGEGSDDSDPQGKINALAHKRASEKSIPFRDAIGQIAAEQPELYRAATEQSRVKV